ncbi:Disintegrin and metalloproteinase domain-containing protein 12 [Apodemus speciosus]|uniref:Disintegrin and metalloproteinase domain-containing protein 12 n=1 Tax=Apodemus speciosus TaxID=105296 RepID=A0ABQ0F0K8_APOSI
MAERPARRAPPARALLLALAGALLAPCAARVDHPDVLTVQLQLESQELILSLERNEGLIANGFTETHYLQDGTDVSFTRNYT